MEEVYNQLFCLLVFAITGITIGILFDIFRIFRKSFKTPDFITYMQDILFWILAGSIVLFSIFKFNHGEIRSYIFVGIALGVFLYIITISKFIIKYCVIILKWLKKIISYPLHFIFNTIHKIIKPILLCIKHIDQKQEKATKNINKHNKNKKKQIILEEKKGIL